MSVCESCEWWGRPGGPCRQCGATYPYYTMKKETTRKNMDELCGTCMHRNVCNFRANAQALIDTIADLKNKEEMRDGTFTITISCKHFIPQTVTSTKNFG